MNGTWYFPTTGGGDDDGINDAGLEQFEGDRERFITRECIQNSLDARVDNKKPVKVEFSRFEMPKLLVPGSEELSDVLERARRYSSNQERSNALYVNALDCMRHDRIAVLKISDYNTTGLNGGDKETDKSWYRLVRSNGTSSMTGDGGGSFGIGKSAPFATSSIRTVFYSTKLADGSVAFQGKARLSSFEQNNDVKRGIGQYGELIGDNKGVKAFRTRESIPDIFEREEQGTDIYVMGYKSGNDWSRKIAEAVLDNFWMAIREKTLEVVIKNEGQVLIAINADNLDETMNRYMGDPETKLYYEAIKDSSREFKDVLPALGEVEFFVKIGAGPKNVLCARRSLMKVHTLYRLRVLPEDYVGVLIVRGESGNQNLRMLEPPAHDKWDKMRGSSENQQALNDLRQYVVDCLRQISSERSTNVEEIPDLGRYLPDDMANDDRDAIFYSEGEEMTFGDAQSETATQHGAHQENTETETIGQTRARVAQVIRPGTIGGDRKKAGKRNRGKGSGGHSGAGEPDGSTKYVDVSGMTVRTTEVSRHGKRAYIIRITPSVDDRGSICVVAFGDGEYFPMDIANVKDTEGNPYKFDGSTIEDLTFKAGQQLELEVELASSRRYALGVK